MKEKKVVLKLLIEATIPFYVLEGKEKLLPKYIRCLKSNLKGHLPGYLDFGPGYVYAEQLFEHCTNTIKYKITDAN